MSEIGETTTVQWDSALEAIERCYELGWTDGLPVVPPTEARVAEFIERSAAGPPARSSASSRSAAARSPSARSRPTP